MSKDDLFGDCSLCQKFIVSLWHACTNLHKHEQKDTTKALAEFSEHILIVINSIIPYSEQHNIPELLDPVIQR